MLNGDFCVLRMKWPDTKLEADSSYDISVFRFLSQSAVRLQEEILQGGHVSFQTEIISFCY